MSACCNCNCNVATDKAKWPTSRKLAVKWINDREWCDLEKFNSLSIRRVTWVEVVVWICRELDG